MLFCAAQAPELFGRDQRYGVLPLYFSRVLTRFDYALARTVGLFLAVLIVSLVPQVVLTVGAILAAAGPGHRHQRRARRYPALPRRGRALVGRLLTGGRRRHRGLDAAARLRDRRDHRRSSSSRRSSSPSSPSWPRAMSPGLLLFASAGRRARGPQRRDLRDHRDARRPCSRPDFPGWVFVAVAIAIDRRRRRARPAPLPGRSSV